MTKEKYSDKPTYDSMRYSLEKMREHAGQHGVKEIAMPRIGCGLDGLQVQSWFVFIKGNGFISGINKVYLANK